MEGVAGEAHNAPFGEDVGADAFIDSDGGSVPFEDVPFEARAALLNGDRGEFGEEGFADSLPAQRWRDVEVFEADAVMAAPGGVAGEVEGKAGGLVFAIGDKGGKARRGSPAVAKQVGFGGDDGVRSSLVGGELVDEAEDGGDIGRGGGADREGRSCWIRITGWRSAGGGQLTRWRCEKTAGLSTTSASARTSVEMTMLGLS